MSGGSLYQRWDKEFSWQNSCLAAVLMEGLRKEGNEVRQNSVLFLAWLRWLRKSFTFKKKKYFFKFLVQCPFMFALSCGIGAVVWGILAYVRLNSHNVSILWKRRGSKKSCERLRYLTRSQETGLISWLYSRIFISVWNCWITLFCKGLKRTQLVLPLLC